MRILKVIGFPLLVTLIALPILILVGKYADVQAATDTFCDDYINQIKVRYERVVKTHSTFSRAKEVIPLLILVETFDDRVCSGEQLMKTVYGVIEDKK